MAKKRNRPVVEVIKLEELPKKPAPKMVHCVCGTCGWKFKKKLEMLNLLTHCPQCDAMMYVRGNIE